VESSRKRTPCLPSPTTTLRVHERHRRSCARQRRGPRRDSLPRLSTQPVPRPRNRRREPGPPGWVITIRGCRGRGEHGRSCPNDPPVRGISLSLVATRFSTSREIVDHAVDDRVDRIETISVDFILMRSQAPPLRCCWLIIVGELPAQHVHLSPSSKITVLGSAYTNRASCQTLKRRLVGRRLGQQPRNHPRCLPSPSAPLRAFEPDRN
jgi:hypothetical protein